MTPSSSRLGRRCGGRLNERLGERNVSNEDIALPRMRPRCPPVPWRAPLEIGLAWWLIAASLLPLVYLLVIPEGASAYTPHTPILIVGDASFLPANGVSAGSGTSGDPYVIEGWDIDASSAHGIEIRTTNAFFIIRDVYVHSGAQSSRDGIRFFGVSNGEVRNATVEGNDDGLIAFGGSNITLRSVLATNNTGAGVEFSGTDNASIDSSRLQNNWIGLRASSLTRTRIAFTEVSGTLGTGSGALLSFVQDATIASSTFANNTGAGLTLFRSDNASIASSLMTGNGKAGIRLNATTNVTLTANRFIDDGLSIVGDAREHYTSHNVTPDNLVNGLPLRYCRNASGFGLDGQPTGQLIVVNSSDVDVRNVTISGTDTAISMSYVDRAALTNNTISGNQGDGVLVSRVLGLEVTSNAFSDNGGTGIAVADSDGLLVRGNGVSRNALGGVTLTATANASVVANVLVSNLGSAVSMSSSSNVSVFGNSFIDYSGGLRATDDGGSGNSWDGGYPVGGNFWSPYSGPDRFGGSGQDQPGADGIGDVPFVIDSDSQDRFPLVVTAAGDTTPPSVTISSPLEAPPIGSSPTSVTGTAEDNLQVSRVEVRVNEGTWVVAAGTTAWTLSAALAVGPNLVEVRAWDIAGNPSPVVAVTLTHDPSPPTLILTGPRDGSATSRPTVLVTGTTEPGATLSANGILVAVAPDGSFSFPLALLEGENILTVTARDPAGNEISRVIRVAYAPPTLPEFDWVMPAFLTAFLASLLALGTLIGFRNGGRRGGPGEEGRPSQDTPSSPPPPPPSLP